MSVVRVIACRPSINRDALFELVLFVMPSFTVPPNDLQNPLYLKGHKHYQYQWSHIVYTFLDN